MKYASTINNNGVETIAVVLELDAVPGFDPENPLQSNTYGVNDDVEIGWVADGAGSFVPPSAGILDARYKAQQRATLIARLAALDQRKIRPLAEGDTAFLATLNAQSAALRSELSALAG